MSFTSSLPLADREVPRDAVVRVDIEEVISFLKCLGFDEAAEAVEHNDWETPCP